ncbi:uncharacterized protein B0I36DRAFT_350499 [Microdochium trichocladiopsis]|uniref:Uncharacterized protein n=1 Tax=Microdochium trichocladiopsis TaxID=1682393 RepID=A0A9P9BMJ0_9PEZI|nr:uncharacterized protein B0I36DRAFT_350499 [Microdochium trichocladiopsis]KAH7029663.1 hypothetical protein B0I36DRAFT_350499 [Microdochium trichocladiopsis]
MDRLNNTLVAALFAFHGASALPISGGSIQADSSDLHSRQDSPTDGLAVIDSVADGSGLNRRQVPSYPATPIHNYLVRPKAAGTTSLSERQVEAAGAGSLNERQFEVVDREDGVVGRRQEDQPIVSPEVAASGPPTKREPQVNGDGGGPFGRRQIPSYPATPIHNYPVRPKTVGAVSLSEDGQAGGAVGRRQENQPILTGAALRPAADAAGPVTKREPQVNGDGGGPLGKRQGSRNPVVGGQIPPPAQKRQREGIPMGSLPPKSSSKRQDGNNPIQMD